MAAVSRRGSMPGAPYPLGATWDGLGTNFAVFAGNAEQIDLCLFDPTGRREIARLALPECTDGVWHGYLPDARAGQLYGYRAHGPYDRSTAIASTQQAAARSLRPQLAGTLRWSDALFGYRLSSPRGICRSTGATARRHARRRW